MWRRIDWKEDEEYIEDQVEEIDETKIKYEIKEGDSVEEGDITKIEKDSRFRLF